MNAVGGRSAATKVLLLTLVVLLLAERWLRMRVWVCVLVLSLLVVVLSFDDGFLVVPTLVVGVLSTFATLLPVVGRWDPIRTWFMMATLGVGDLVLILVLWHF